jgi:hypothetical protein
MLVCSIATKSYGWSVQQGAYCDDVGFEVDFYKYCIPHQFYLDTIDVDHVLIASKVTTTTVGFKFKSYAGAEDKTQENGHLVYKGKSQFMGYPKYVHHFEMPDVPRLYRWTIVMKENEFYLQVTGFSEKDVSNVLEEILSTKK